MIHIFKYAQNFIIYEFLFVGASVYTTVTAVSDLVRGGCVTASSFWSVCSLVRAFRMSVSCSSPAHIMLQDCGELPVYFACLSTKSRKNSKQWGVFTYFSRYVEYVSSKINTAQLDFWFVPSLIFLWRILPHLYSRILSDFFLLSYTLGWVTCRDIYWSWTSQDCDSREMYPTCSLVWKPCWRELELTQCSYPAANTHQV